MLTASSFQIWSLDWKAGRLLGKEALKRCRDCLVGNSEVVDQLCLGWEGRWGRETEAVTRECKVMCYISRGLALCLTVPALVHILFVFFSLCLHTLCGFVYVILVCTSEHISLVSLCLYTAPVWVSLCMFCLFVSSCISSSVHVSLRSPWRQLGMLSPGVSVCSGLFWLDRYPSNTSVSCLATRSPSLEKEQGLAVCGRSGSHLVQTGITSL